MRYVLQCVRTLVPGVVGVIVFDHWDYTGPSSSSSGLGMLLLKHWQLLECCSQRSVYETAKACSIKKLKKYSV